MVTGRNSVVEALRAKIPATALYVAARIEYDDRVKEALSIATKRGLPVLEVMRPELDRLSGPDSVHQGLALKVPPYEYAYAPDLLDKIVSRGQTPLLVALDGVTDPRNLGAIVRSVARVRRAGRHRAAAPLGRHDGRRRGRPRPAPRRASRSRWRRT